ncbi:Sulfide:quinone oxidoreductase mitochondrial precursor [Curvularia clavata]|uniref:Sulfide:quinone oxidoreductase mitochondrial n=1 Tax=Curvularia clavata TaxID=95742 RepID=A0A9Q9DW83_CURCL|nr:Sulfide:quinone oxidoreductase mitochondrial precursor [Curvularia clavata]
MQSLRQCRRRIGDIRPTATRNLATVSPVVTAVRNHKVVVVGNGSAGVALSHQLLRKGKFAKDDIAVIDPAIWHHYQPGWTLVGCGLKDKKSLRKPMDGLADEKLKFYNKSVATFHPSDNSLSLSDGDKINYDQLVVAPGVRIDYSSVKGLSEAMADPDSLVASIYSYDHCDKVFKNIQRLKSGSAIFTQPTGVIKCAGAPQKIMWLALDHWRKAGLYQSGSDKSAINITFATGLSAMFGVPKYSAKLEELRKHRGVEGLFEHNLVSIDGNTATFARPNGQDKVHRHFEFLHVAPRNVPHEFVSASELSNEAGYVDVDQHSLQHKKWNNVWSLGDAANLPTSKTVAAITSQAVVLTQNILRNLEGKEVQPEYDGYTSCPLLTGEKKVLLAEFKYGGEPKETFNQWLGIDQAVPRRAFYHLKKDFFPWVYNMFHIKGQWGGPKGWIR